MGKHLRRDGALIKINVQRKFSYCRNHDGHCDFQDWPLSLEGPQHPRSLEAASLAAFTEDLNHRMPGYFLMLPSASNCLR